MLSLFGIDGQDLSFGEIKGFGESIQRVPFWLKIAGGCIKNQSECSSADSESSSTDFECPSADSRWSSTHFDEMVAQNEDFKKLPTDQELLCVVTTATEIKDANIVEIRFFK